MQLGVLDLKHRYCGINSRQHGPGLITKVGIGVTVGRFMAPAQSIKTKDK